MKKCNKDCFSCIYVDCIYDELEYVDYRLSDELDKEILKEGSERRRKPPTEELREKQKLYSRYYREKNSEKVRATVRAYYHKDIEVSRARVRDYQRRIKGEEKAKHTNVHDCKNENVLEYWKEWRRRKLGGEKTN